jgi:hypothetical protein
MATDPRRSSLENLLAARLRPAPALPPLPAWRREERWAHGPGSDDGFVYTYDGDAHAPLRLPESHAFVGARVWDAAVLHAKWLEAVASRRHTRVGADGDAARGEAGGGGTWCNPTTFVLAHSVVVELGAGTGLVGLVAATLGGGRCAGVLTDQPPLVPQLAANAAAAGLAGRVHALPLTWGNDEHARGVVEAAAVAAGWAGGDDSGGQGPTLTDALLLACDMAAPVRDVPPFVCSLRALCRGLAERRASATAVPRGEAWRGPRLLLAVQHHREFTPPLLAALAAEGCDVARVPDASLHPAYVSPRHSVYVVTPPAAWVVCLERSAVGGWV